MNLKMTMKELMLQRKKRMMMTILSLILGIFYHQVLLKVLGLIFGYPPSLLMMRIFMPLNLKMVLILTSYLLEKTTLMLRGGRNCLIQLKKRRGLVSGR